MGAPHKRYTNAPAMLQCLYSVPDADTDSCCAKGLCCPLVYFAQGAFVDSKGGADVLIGSSALPGALALAHGAFVGSIAV